jgi:hypothetical protein
MENGNLYTLIPLADFKAILGIDDREDALSRYCLMTATFTIEQYCIRRFLKMKHHESLTFTGDSIFPLRSYPVREVLGVWEYSDKGEPCLVEPDLYHTIPDYDGLEDIPYCLSVSPALRLIQNIPVLKVQYWAGYAPGETPPDLASACLELAAWNIARYRGRRIGVTGNVRGSGKDGEHLEASMPENIRLLLEPYRRKVI